MLRGGQPPIVNMNIHSQIWEFTQAIINYFCLKLILVVLDLLPGNNFSFNLAPLFFKSSQMINWVPDQLALDPAGQGLAILVEPDLIIYIVFLVFSDLEHFG